MKPDKIILLTSLAIFLVMLIFAVLLQNNSALSINLIFFGIIILTFPYSIYRFFRFKRIRAYEKEFPNFLRDIAESQRAGLSLVQAIQGAAKSEYGVLTNEIRKMEKQLSWNVPLDRVLKKFGERMSESVVIKRTVMVMDQANKSGGDIQNTMDSLADNIESLREVQEEKNVLLNQQVIMMYAIFFIFLGITLALMRFLIPLLQAQSLTGGVGGISFTSNPCSLCINNNDAACFGCHTFFAISTAFEFGKQEDASAYYKSLFFAMILVQGFFTGLIAGQIGSDSVVAGVKHSMVMLFVGFTIFILSVRMGIV